MRLPPGDYFGVAITDVEPGAWTDPSFLSQARDRATPFTLAPGETKSVDLPLSPAPVCLTRPRGPYDGNVCRPSLVTICAAPGATQTVTTFTTVPPGTAPQQPGQPANNNAQLPPGTATLRGHVFAADSGQPLRKAQVRIFANETRENRMATTDANGGYEFTEVRAGRYTISASKGSYVGLSYGQQRPTDAGKPLQILDNQTVERVDSLAAIPAWITGRIVDADGEPMSEVQIARSAISSLAGTAPFVSRPAGRQRPTTWASSVCLATPPGQSTTCPRRGGTRTTR